MDTFAQRLQEAMTLRQMKAVDLSLQSGVDESSISYYLKGKFKAKQDKLHSIAKALDVNETWLMGLDVSMERKIENEGFTNILPIQTFRIPILGSINCGEPAYADEDFEGYVDVGTGIRADFALRCKGDSMIGARIYDGDIVFIRKQQDVADGEIAAIILDDEATLKRVYKLPGGRSQLRAENPRYSPIDIGGDNEARRVRILGKAVAFQGDVV